MRIDYATQADIVYVATRMRDSDYREFSALLPVSSRYGMVDELAKRYSYRDDVMVAKLNGEPVAIGAAFEARPNVITLFFFATDKLPLIGGALTRFMKQRFFPRLVTAGVHRFECVSIEGHTQAHRWIRTLGLTPETPEPLRGYGKNGENFIQFSWVRDDLRKTGA